MPETVILPLPVDSPAPLPLHQRAYEEIKQLIVWASSLPTLSSPNVSSPIASE